MTSQPQGAVAGPPRARHAGWAVALALLALVAHGRGLSNGFVWDDEYVLVENAAVHDLRNVPRFFADPATSASAGGPVHYRPLRATVLAVVYAIFGPRAAAYHAVYVLLHVVNVLLAFAAVRLLTGSLARSAIVAAVFAVHPLMSEAVASIAGGDALYAAFYLSALVLHLRAVGRRACSWRTTAAVAVPFSLALLSKEMAVTFPLLVTFLDAVRPRGAPARALRGRPYALHLATLYALSAAFVAVRTAVMSGMRGGEYEGGTFARTMAMQAEVVVEYLRLAVLPAGQTIRHCLPIPASPWDARVLGSVAVLAALAAAALALRRRVPDLLAGLGWFAIALLPVMNVVPLPGSMMGERFAYVACLGVFLALSTPAAFLDGVERWWLRAPGVAMAALVAVLGAATVARTARWKDNLTIFEDAVAVCPMSNAVRIYLLREYERRGRLADARAQYEAAVANTREWRDSYRAFGDRALSAGAAGEAAIWYRRALRMDPADEDARAGLARAVAVTGER